MQPAESILTGTGGEQKREQANQSNTNNPLCYRYRSILKFIHTCDVV